jgi:D-alanine-D-alanine ligase
MKAVVLHGDVSEDAGMDEKDALVQAAFVSSALSDLGYEPIIIPFSLNLSQTTEMLKEIRPVFIFNLVETLEGQGSLIHVAPSLMDYLKIPYTGAGTEATFLTSNKVLAKQFLQAADIATPPFFLPDERYSGSFVEGTYIVKAVWEHASSWLDENSIIFTQDRHRLSKAILSRQEQLGVACFAEVFIEGREFNLSMLAGDKGTEVLPPAEIRFDDFPPGKARVVDYRSKWVEDSFEYHHTPRCFDFPKEDEPLLHQLTDLALWCWRLFGLHGYARVDFRVDKTGRPWVLEVNTNPCLSPDGGFFAAVERSGLSFTRAIEGIVNDVRK